MLKNLTQNQILLIAMATLLLLLAALSFYLLQNPFAPLPFAPAPPTSTLTATPVRPTNTPEPSRTSTPTRQTSYTPFVTQHTSTPTLGTPLTSETITPMISVSPSPGSPATTPTHQSVLTATQDHTPLPGTATLTSTTIPPTATLTFTPSTATVSPTPSPTLTHGETMISGRIVQNGTPVPNVIVWFEDDTPVRQSTTDAGGHYSFVTLAPGTHFTLTFNQNDNHQLAPAIVVASLARLEGTLPLGADTIQFPDLEISLNIEAMMFQLLSPVDGATYSAAYISPSNPIQFIWSLYGRGGSYHIELGPNGSNAPIWTSSQLASTNAMWDGSLDNDAHIVQGAYWWSVAVTTSLGQYVLDLYTQPFDLLFNP